MRNRNIVSPWKCGVTFNVGFVINTRIRRYANSDLIVCRDTKDAERGLAVLGCSDCLMTRELYNNLIIHNINQLCSFLSTNQPIIINQ